MPDPYQYATLRVVPDVDRGERINVGVVLFVRTLGFLGARAHVDRARLAALAPELDADRLARHLDHLVLIASGAPDAGPIAALPPHQRFHWLTSPASTVVQPSRIHTGTCDDPADGLERLFRRLVPGAR